MVIVVDVVVRNEFNSFKAIHSVYKMKSYVKWFVVAKTKRSTPKMHFNCWQEHDDPRKNQTKKNLNKNM